jgi:hypothetical protein
MGPPGHQALHRLLGPAQPLGGGGPAAGAGPAGRDALRRVRVRVPPRAPLPRRGAGGVGRLRLPRARLQAHSPPQVARGPAVARGLRAAPRRAAPQGRRLTSPATSACGGLLRARRPAPVPPTMSGDRPWGGGGGGGHKRGGTCVGVKAAGESAVSRRDETVVSAVWGACERGALGPRHHRPRHRLSRPPASSPPTESRRPLARQARSAPLSTTGSLARVLGRCAIGIARAHPPWPAEGPVADSATNSPVPGRGRAGQSAPGTDSPSHARVESGNARTPKVGPRR